MLWDVPPCSLVEIHIYWHLGKGSKSEQARIYQKAISKQRWTSPREYSNHLSANCMTRFGSSQQELVTLCDESEWLIDQPIIFYSLTDWKWVLVHTFLYSITRRGLDAAWCAINVVPALNFIRQSLWTQIRDVYSSRAFQLLQAHNFAKQTWNQSDMINIIIISRWERTSVRLSH